MTPPRRIVRCLYDRSIGLVRRDPAPYASHLPILVGVSTLVRPSKVVEFGSGECSTVGFTDRKAFPHLKALRSFENDREWHARVVRLIASDSRAEIEFVSGAMADAATPRNLEEANLIFVDDSDVEGRVATIEAIARLRPRTVPVIVHDYELWRLRRTRGLFEHSFCFALWNPQTAVLWNGRPDWPKGLGALTRLLRQNLSFTPVHDIAKWGHILAQLPECLEANAMDR